MRQVSGVLGRAGSFWACFGLAEQLNPGLENIKSELNGVDMPRFGLILTGSVATASGMPLAASESKNCEKTTKN